MNMPGEALVLLIDAALRVTVVVAGGWALTALMRRASASARHFTWMCTIVAAAAMPAAAVVMPDWKVPYVSRMAVAVAPTTPALRSGVAAVASDGGDRATVASRQSVTAPLNAMPRPAIVLLIWLAGAVAVGLYAASGMLAARRLRQRSAIAVGSWADEARALASSLGVFGSITFVESAETEIPMVCGLWRAAVVMPCAAAEWPHERVNVALLHELAHVRRRDCLTQAFAQTICALHWFNPLVWVAARRLRDERERACDDFVLETGTRRSAYAAHLLEIARRMGSQLPAAARAGVSMAHCSRLEGRLMAILNPGIRRSAGLFTRLGAAVAILVVAIPVAAVQLQDAADPAPDAPQSAVILEGPGSLVLSGQATMNGFEGRWEGDKLVIHQSRSGEDKSGASSADEYVMHWTKGTNDRTEHRRARAIDRALVESAADGDLQGVNDLIAAGADVNAVDRSGHGSGSPLIAAAREGRLGIARLLLDRGADPNMSVPNYGNPIIAAALGGNAALVELLLQRGADVDQVADGNESALMQVSAAGRLDMVKLLVSRGADVNKRIWVDWLETKVMLEKATGAVVTIVNDGAADGEWRSPLSAARRGEHAAVVNYLIGKGAQD